MNKLVKNGLALLMMQGINYLIPLVTLPYLTRVLGIYQYGALNTALNIMLYAILFVDFGFNLSSTKSIAKNKHNKYEVSRVFWSTICAKVAISAIILTVMFVFVYHIDKYNEIRVTLYYLVPQLIGNIIFPVWLFQGLERIYIISVLSVLTKIMTIPLLLFFVTSPGDVNAAAAILGVPVFVSGVIAAAVILHWRIIEKINWKKIDIKETIKASAPIFLGSVAISLYTLSTPLILSLVSSFYQVGYFVAADKLRNAILGCFLILGQAIYPRANALLHESIEKYYSFIKKLIIYQVMLSIIGMISFYFIMPVMAPILLGVTFPELSIMIKIMSPMILLIPSSVILANCILLPMDNNRCYAIIPMIAAIIHLPYSFFLAKNYGAIGASVAILITEFISFALLFYVCHKFSYINKVFFNK